ncbi:MAG TPA: S-methyl-5'-thioadenosine phosphorylase [Conexivisphaerales archaeon]|nr:S-methyl-5'-thioadenosine phosphorylase [Conexivisphaerales archaeon]
MQAEIGIIGGSGVYDISMLKGAEEVKVYTPYGETSDRITLGEFGGRKVAFIPRHGKGHRIPPHRVNYRANIWALKELGVTRIIAPSAVGSLQPDVVPGQIVFPDQFIDMTKKRDYTFYDGGPVAHVSMADPFCPEMRELAESEGRRISLDLHPKGTYVCIEGPRFSTRAESALFKGWGAHVIGMTLVPEANLAREKGICYLTVAMVTDYDVWAERPVTALEVVETLAKNVESVQRLLTALVPALPKERSCGCGDSLKDSVV